MSFAVKHDVSPPLRSLGPLPPPVGPAPERVIPRGDPRRPLGDTSVVPGSPDAALQRGGVTRRMPLPIQSFDGLSNADNLAILGTSPVAPDTNGDVGPNHYVQMINNLFAVYDKTGTRLYGPAATNTLWTGFGGFCETTNDRDPIVLYDKLADRWLLSKMGNANSNTGPFAECIAISATPDPTGAYIRYAFPFTKLPDYPKFGLWPDAYYMSIDQYNAGVFTNAGGGVVAFQRDHMLVGGVARMVYFDVEPVDASFRRMLPSDLRGPAPPVGAPNYFAGVVSTSMGSPTDRLQVFEFHVDWSNTASSAFSVPLALDVTPFTPPCVGGVPCILQLGTAARLEDRTEHRLMNRLQYRNFGSYQTLVTNHTVDASNKNHAGVRWYELRKSGANPWSIFQQGTYAPDGEHRWLGSAAMDGAGNIAIGYNVSSSTNFPSIRYAGRIPSDPAGTLAQGEATLVAGGGSQTDPDGRWGDYTALVVDPNDDCTFWFTTEYYATTSANGWRPRIGSFRVTSCLPLAASPTPTSTAIGAPTATPTPIPTSTSTPTPASGSTATPTSTATSCILGDINCDGIVDIRDYGLWRQNFGATNCGNPADLNGDCIVDIRDYGTWRANFGHTSGATAPQAAAPTSPPTGTATPTPRADRGPASRETGSAWDTLLKAVQALGITFPDEIRLQVTEVIQ